MGSWIALKLAVELGMRIEHRIFFFFFFSIFATFFCVMEQAGSWFE